VKLRRWTSLGSLFIAAAVTVAACQMPPQVADRPPQRPDDHVRSQDTLTDPGSRAEAELQTGITLTRKGLFREAIPHLQRAQGNVLNQYALHFDLALCYVGTGNFKQAIPVLDSLRRNGHDNADVNDLLAQAYIGNLQDIDAFDALKRAVALTPQNEKLYLLVADACTERQNYAFGLKVVDLGMQHLPYSGRLHYERGVILSLLDEFDLAKSDFRVASELAPDSQTAYMAAAQENMFAGNMPLVIQVAREGLRKDRENPVLLSILGEALIRSGASPGESEFVEAQAALEKSLSERPNSSRSLVTLAKVYIMLGRLDEAILHLQKARELDPGNPAVYADLARAYRGRGEPQQAESMLAVLAQINQKQAETIASAPGDRKVSYGGSRLEQQTDKAPP
jgi:tetratricopeptide (TPR) repeat protein